MPDCTTEGKLTRVRDVGRTFFFSTRAGHSFPGRIPYGPGKHSTHSVGARKGSHASGLNESLLKVFVNGFAGNSLGERENDVQE